MTATPPSPPNAPASPRSEGNPRRYRAVSTAAVISLALGVFSVLAFWNPAWLLISVAGILAGWIALRRIRANPEELTGTAIAWIGIGASALLGLLAVIAFLFARAHEFPYGYQRVDYEMLQAEPDPSLPKGTYTIPEAAYELQYDPTRNNKIGIAGYMYPTRGMTGLKRFLLCPAIPNCPSCAPNPVPTEIIHVTLEGDLTAVYTTGLVHVGGKFRIDTASPDGVPYYLDADFLSE